MVLKVKWRVAFTGVYKTGAYSAAHKWVDCTSLKSWSQESSLESGELILKFQESRSESSQEI